jgi:hypothetical protein
MMNTNDIPSLIRRLAALERLAVQQQEDYRLLAGKMIHMTDRLKEWERVARLHGWTIVSHGEDEDASQP